MSARESADYAAAEGATTPVISQATGLVDVSHSGETPFVRRTEGASGSIWTVHRSGKANGAGLFG
jgi:hypothetical protein